MSDENSKCLGLHAMVNVALQNTANTILRPIHTARVIVGAEREKTVTEMLRDEETRLSERDHHHTAAER